MKPSRFLIIILILSTKALSIELSKEGLGLDINEELWGTNEEEAALRGAEQEGLSNMSLKYNLNLWAKSTDNSLHEQSVVFKKNIVYLNTDGSYTIKGLKEGDIYKVSYSSEGKFSASDQAGNPISKEEISEILQKHLEITDE